MKLDDVAVGLMEKNGMFECLEVDGRHCNGGMMRLKVLVNVRFEVIVFD